MKERIDPTLANQLAEGSPEKKIDALFAYIEARGQSYYDEVVTQLEHALQCANLAQLANGDAIQITAALLHDIGHFLMDEHAENADFHTQDFLHEEVGAAYIAPIHIKLSICQGLQFLISIGGFSSGIDPTSVLQTAFYDAQGVRGLPERR